MEIKQNNGARKNDGNKPKLGLIHPALLIQTAFVLEEGDAQYGEGNWKGLFLSRVIDAMDRHLLAIKSGEDIDSKSCKPHYAHIAAGCSFLAWYHENGVLGSSQDDRPWLDHESRTRAAQLEPPPRGLDDGFDLPTTLTELQGEIVEWADHDIGPCRTYRDAITKLVMEELPELLLDPESALEWADVMILVMDLAHLAKIDMADAVREKLNINRNREWNRDERTGLFHHVSPAGQELIENKAEEVLRNTYGKYNIGVYDKVRIQADGRAGDEVWTVDGFEFRHEEFTSEMYAHLSNEKFAVTTKLSELVPA